MAKEVKYEIIEEFGVIEESPKSDWCTEVNKIAWHGKAPKIDIRDWNRGGDEPKMGKGITLTDEGCEELVRVLLEMGFGDIKTIKKAYKDRKEV